MEMTEEQKKEMEDAMFKFKWGIDYIVEGVKKFPKLVSKDICGDSEFTYEMLSKLICDSVDMMKKFEENIAAKRNKVLDILDASWSEISKKHYDLEQKVKDIQNKKLDFDTYRMKELLEVLSALDRIPQETWTRFETICVKLKK